jgi:oxidase EvaA
MKPPSVPDTGASFLRSALAGDSPLMPLARFHEWLEEQRQRQRLEVVPVPFRQLDQWRFTPPPLALAHVSGKFFRVEGLRVETDFGPKAQWDQPIIHQPEIGILGIISREIRGIRHFLMQTKMEPGNINGVQLTPTEQATRSNYTLIHGGRCPVYNAYFTEPGKAHVLVDRLLGEQGSRFLEKRNRNMIVEVDRDIPVEPGFCWLTLGQIKRLLWEDNLINMSARSVLSCIPFGSSLLDAPPGPDWSSGSGFGGDLLRSLLSRDGALHSTNALLNWLFDLRARYQLRRETRPLDQLDAWTMEEDRIHHESGRHFSVIAVTAEAVGREVKRWTQPILSHSGRGLNGLVTQKIGGLLHLLVRACLFPGGNELFELGSTVSRANAANHFGSPDAPPFLHLFRDPPPSWVRFSALESEEGGRFHHFQSRYMVLEIPETLSLELPENYRWMTVNQLNLFNQWGYVNMEGRNLLMCLDYAQ